MLNAVHVYIWSDKNESDMGAFISRQPNGLLCRFSTVVDTVTHYNMTEEEYIELCAESARDEARWVLKNNLAPYDCIKSEFRATNMTRKEFKAICKEMERTDDKNIINKEVKGEPICGK